MRREFFWIPLEEKLFKRIIILEAGFGLEMRDYLKNLSNFAFCISMSSVLGSLGSLYK
jgi:hypothetical protein